MPSHSRKNIQAAVYFLSQANIFFYLLLWLMALLVAGTISEKYLGLYQSQKLFFGSFVIWLGGIIPVPGGTITLALIFINLLAKLIIEKWTKQKAGTFVVHCGALLLLLGGFLTATFSTEGAMMIEEGGTAHYMEDYHQVELALINAHGEEMTFDQKLLQKDQTVNAPLPFTIKIEQIFENTDIQPRLSPINDGSVHGMLVANEMKPAPLSAEENRNHVGIIFSVSGADKNINGRYALFEDMPIMQHLVFGKDTYTIDLRRKRTELPFTVKLIKFEKQLYPGTDKPRGFQSEVVLQDGAVQWHSLISMNNPLRYKGYTFYQSSFVDGADKPTTVLAVVKNIGAVFPYISSIIICIGLLIHLFLRIPKLQSTHKTKGMTS